MSRTEQRTGSTFRLYHPVVLVMCIHGFVFAGQKHPSDPYGPSVHFFKDRFHRGADRIFGHIRETSFNIFDDIFELSLWLELLVCGSEHVGNVLTLCYHIQHRMFRTCYLVRSVGSSRSYLRALVDPLRFWLS